MEMEKVYTYPATRKLKNGGTSTRMVSKKYTPHPRKSRDIDVSTFSDVLYSMMYGRKGQRAPLLPGVRKGALAPFIQTPGTKGQSAPGKLVTLKQHGISYYDFKKQCVKDFGTDNIEVIKREFEGWNPRPKAE